MIGIMLIITAVLIMQIPVPEADASSFASDFKMDGTTLISYTGTATDVSVPSDVKVIGEGASPMPASFRTCSKSPSPWGESWA